MENTAGLIEPLFEKLEQYGKTNIELMKLKAVDKIAAVTSFIVSRFIRMVIFFFFVIMASVGSAFYIGDLWGNDYSGFLIVAAFYALIGIILFFIQNYIKCKINDSIIKQLLK